MSDETKKLDVTERAQADESAADRLDPRVNISEQESFVHKARPLGENDLSADEVQEQLRAKNEFYDQRRAEQESSDSEDEKDGPVDPRQAATSRSAIDKKQEANLSPEAQRQVQASQAQKAKPEEKRSLADKILHPTK